MRNSILPAHCDVKAAMANKKAASLWEYLLVIAIVCIIGGALISVITGSGGIASLWNGLMTKFTSWLNLAPTAP